MKQMEELTILRKEQAEMDAVEKPAFALAKFGNVESKLVKEHGLTRVAYHGPSGATERTLPLGGTNRANTQTHQFLQRKPVAEKGELLTTVEHSCLSDDETDFSTLQIRPCQNRSSEKKQFTESRRYRKREKQ